MLTIMSKNCSRRAELCDRQGHLRWWAAKVRWGHPAMFKPLESRRARRWQYLGSWAASALVLAVRDREAKTGDVPVEEAFSMKS